MQILSKIKAEWILVGLALGLGSFFAWYVYTLGINTILIDQFAHLNTARQVIDSMTPGITQLGFWPPLLHIILLPFVAFDFLYRTGLAAAFALVPILALAVFFLYRVFFLFTRNPWVSFIGGLLFLLNPYVLYYAVTPMTEVLFLAMLLGTIYFLLLWLRDNKYVYLVLTAVFITLASLSRFEGLLLVPLVGGIVITAMVLAKKRYQEIEANLILFFFIAVLGGVAIVAYSWFFGDDPMAFVNSNWSAFSQQQDYLRPAQGSLGQALQYLGHASYHMLGKTQIIIAILSFVALLFLFPRLETMAVGLLLLSPFIFDWFSLYQGNIVVYVEELPPFDWFNNERYGLYAIGFVVFAPVLLIYRGLSSIKHGIADKMLLGGMALLPLLLLQGYTFYKVALQDEYRVVQADASKAAAIMASQFAAAKFLANNYDHGKILMTRATYDLIALRAGIPIRNYIYESNYPYYEQTLLAPWLFSRWVVMLNRQADASSDILNWVKQNERVSQTWSQSPVFNRYYNLAYANNYVRIYKLDEAEVRSFALSQSFSPEEIPSLNPELAWWNGATGADLAAGKRTIKK